MNINLTLLGQMLIYGGWIIAFVVLSVYAAKAMIKKRSNNKE